MINERDYFQSLDPYDRTEFHPVSIDIRDGTTGTRIDTKEAFTISEIAAILNEAAKQATNRGITTIHIVKSPDKRDGFWS